MKFHVVLFLLLFLLVAWLFEVNYAHPFSSAGILPIEQKGAHSNHSLKTIQLFRIFSSAETGRRKFKSADEKHHFSGRSSHCKD